MNKKQLLDYISYDDFMSRFRTANNEEIGKLIGSGDNLLTGLFVPEHDYEDSSLKISNDFSNLPLPLNKFRSLYTNCNIEKESYCTPISYYPEIQLVNCSHPQVDYHAIQLRPLMHSIHIITHTLCRGATLRNTRDLMTTIWDYLVDNEFSFLICGSGLGEDKVLHLDHDLEELKKYKYSLVINK